MNSEFFGRWSAGVLDRVEQALDAWVPANAPAGLGDAMRYAVLDGGKRLRALLVQAAAEAVDASASTGGVDAAMRAACAVELIHAYSLVHDDMPCMDNDVLRRGKPTVHIRFGEAQAMLAGDAMQALAFEVFTKDELQQVEAEEADAPQADDPRKGQKHADQRVLAPARVAEALPPLPLRKTITRLAFTPGRLDLPGGRHVHNDLPSCSN